MQLIKRQKIKYIVVNCIVNTMRIQVTILITIIYIFNKISDVKSDDLEELTMKTKVLFEDVDKALDTAPHNNERIEANAKKLVRKLKYFSAAAEDIPDARFGAVLKHLHAAEDELSQKHTRGILDKLPTPEELVDTMKGKLKAPMERLKASPKKALGYLKEAVKLITSGNLVASMGQLGGRTAKAGFDVLTAASDLAATTLETLYPTGNNAASEDKNDQNLGISLVKSAVEAFSEQ